MAMTESDTARSGPPRVVFPEWDEPRVTQARRRLEAEGVCRPVPPEADADALSTVLVEGRGMKPAIARRMLKRPLFRGAAMVAAGRAEAMVAGTATPTRRVVEAAAIGIGMADGVTVPSSCFL